MRARGRLRALAVRGAATADDQRTRGSGVPRPTSKRHTRGPLVDAAADPRPRRDRRPWIALAAGFLVAIGIGGSCGVVMGPIAALVVLMALRRMEPAWLRRARARDLADLPFALDVFACSLRAGAPLDLALTTTAEAVNSQLAERFRRAARALRLGATIDEALSELDGTPGADRITSAICRSAGTGAMLADGLALLAVELRAEREQTAQAGAHRAGVWMVLPLCLCFLPAFIVGGLLPVVVSSLDGILNIQ